MLGLSSPQRILTLLALSLALLFCCPSDAGQADIDVKADASMTLDRLHQYASEANWESYFKLYTEDARFIGTDASENWGMQEFEQYARPTKGWRYTVTHRSMVHRGDVMVFDEQLDSASYGKCRGSGTLVRTDTGWKVLQYHLSFPIPNTLAKHITAQLKAATQ